MSSITVILAPGTDGRWYTQVVATDANRVIAWKPELLTLAEVLQAAEFVVTL